MTKGSLCHHFCGKEELFPGGAAEGRRAVAAPAGRHPDLWVSWWPAAASSWRQPARRSSGSC
nr:hypothetical protein [Streptomyces sp. AA0539]